MRRIYVYLGMGLLSMMSACSTATDSAVDNKDRPVWLECDSVEAIHQRMLNDFPLTFEEGAAQLIEAYPEMTVDSIRRFVDMHYVETMNIDGQERMFRKAVRNLGLLCPSLNGGWQHRGCDASPVRISYADSVIRYTNGSLPDGGAHRITLRFSIDVPFDEALRDDTLRVWMPYPLESERQTDIELVSSSPAEHIISSPKQSLHRTIYMEAPVLNDTVTHFEYEVSFTTMGKYYNPSTIAALVKTYDKRSDNYRKYTTFEGPHYVRLDKLAKSIVGDETDPFRQSELVYDYIVNHYPWAGAREYSTIPCIPEYVISQGHGDCGQVALLYISLMRTLGVPARWESGWMLHPGEKNFHDWAEVYFEGVGWVPVDVSFGRYTSSDNKAIPQFYSTGIDSYRFATNAGIGDVLYPPKRYIRSETVDLQAGEVESTKGNLYFPAWSQHLEVIKSVPVQ